MNARSPTPRHGLWRPFITMNVEVCPPGQPAFVGTVKAAMYQHGAVHHYRVAEAGGVLWLTPPAWLPPYSLQVAEMACDQRDAQFLHIMQTVPHDIIWKVMAAVMHMPDGLTSDEMVARLQQRRQELVH